MAEETPTTAQINIKGKGDEYKDKSITFEFPLKFAEGHTCTAAEAKALNQTMKENLSNQFRARAQACIAGEEDALSEKELQKEFNARAGEYEFTLSNAGGGRSALSPIEKAAKKIAMQVVGNKLAEEGITKKAYFEADEANKEKYAENVAKLMENEKVLALAKKRVESEEKELEALGL